MSGTLIINRSQRIGGGSTPPAVPVIGIELSQNSLEVTEGNILRLFVCVSPPNATNKNFTWNSNNENIAIVDENGYVMGINAGIAIISVSTVDGGFSDSCTVTVYAPDSPLQPPPKPVISINSQPASNTNVTEGIISGSLSLSASVTEAASLSYQWYSNASASNSGGSPIGGALSSSFPIPTILTAGSHYYYCVVSATGGAVPVSSNLATVIVAAPPPPPFKMQYYNMNTGLFHDVPDSGVSDLSFNGFHFSLTVVPQNNNEIETVLWSCNEGDGYFNPDNNYIEVTFEMYNNSCEITVLVNDFYIITRTFNLD